MFSFAAKYNVNIRIKMNILLLKRIGGKKTNENMISKSGSSENYGENNIPKIFIRLETI